MAGKEDGTSKANGVKPDDKGKGKVEDLKEQQNPDQDMKDKDTNEKDGKVLPPGIASLQAFIPGSDEADGGQQRSSARRTRS
jgi:hypothetical protein